MTNTTIESKVALLPKRIEDVYAFMADMNHHGQIIPPEEAELQSTEHTCSFTITGTGNLKLRIKEKLLNKLISIEPDGKAPFSFVLIWKFKKNKTGCMANAVIEATMNPIIKMVATKPLKKFLDMQADGLMRHFAE